MSEEFVHEVVIRRRYRLKLAVRDFLKYDQRFREVRARARDKMSKCFLCQRRFNDGEALNILMFDGTANKAGCTTCVDGLPQALVKQRSSS